MLGALGRGMKDGVLAMSIKAFVNDKFGAYGDVTECSVDTKSNKLVLHALMKGEKEKVTATIERYEIEEVKGETFIVLKRFTSSREWLALLLNRYFMDKRYKLPSAVTKLL